MDPPMFEAPEGWHRYKGIKRTGMRYRDVDYTIVQERQLWKWGFAVYNKSHTGEAATKTEAVSEAERAIDRALSLGKLRVVRKKSER